MPQVSDTIKDCVGPATEQADLNDVGKEISTPTRSAGQAFWRRCLWQAVHLHPTTASGRRQSAALWMPDTVSRWTAARRAAQPILRHASRTTIVSPRMLNRNQHRQVL